MISSLASPVSIFLLYYFITMNYMVSIHVLDLLSRDSVNGQIVHICVLFYDPVYF